MNQNTKNQQGRRTVNKKCLDIIEVLNQEAENNRKRLKAIEKLLSTLPKTLSPESQDLLLQMFMAFGTEAQKKSQNKQEMA